MFSAEPYFDINKLSEWNSEFNLGLREKKVNKAEVFLREGQRCDHLYFIHHGFVRVYYLDINGNEKTHWFSRENSIITSPYSYIKGERNILFFEALEDTQMTLVSSSQMEVLVRENPKVGESFRFINAEFAMVLSRRIMALHTQTAEDRYLQLMKEHPNLFKKAKLAHIASFLGVTQQSLSRIRKNI